MKHLFILLFASVALLSNAQTFNKGALVINANYGVPKTSYFVAKKAINFAFDQLKDEKGFQGLSLDLKGNGVFSGRVEYGVNEYVGVGVSLAYWNLIAKVQHTYLDTNVVTKTYGIQADDISLKYSVLGAGVRCNFHFLGNQEDVKVDPFIGAALGVSIYSLGLDFKSSIQDKKLPDYGFKLAKFMGLYTSPTFGLRYYPVKPVALNFELGWDKGALLLAGIAVKINTDKKTENKK